MNLRGLLALLLWACALGRAVADDTPLKNQLAGHPSPYLAMHGHDPVAWQAWGETALRRARESGKPLYLSSGYFACYWCHVMQHESYADPEVAKWLNRYFIPVKIDRELQPGLDAYLIEFVTATRGHAGWPLNVFLTPDGYPIVGFTYQRRDPFLRLLKRLAGAWKNQRGTLERMARRASSELLQTSVDDRKPHDIRPDVLRARILKQARAAGDELQGGFGNQSKFPMPGQLDLLLDLLAGHDDGWTREFLTLTLDHMARRGLRDPLGGGFFRYCVDPAWRTPHFEKMLYTQALLARLYLKAARVLKRPDYREVARDTLNFLLATLKAGDGAFIASLSAVDDQGIEGGYYRWSRAELTQNLEPDERRLAGLAWGLGIGEPDDEGGWLPRQRATPSELARALKLDEATIQQRLKALRGKLLSLRSKRSLPRDSKPLGAWNGLVLSALADATLAFDDAAYRTAARRLRDYLAQRLWDGRRLARMRLGERAVGVASLADYAYIAAGLADWARASGRAEPMLPAILRAGFRYFASDKGWRNASARLLPEVTVTPAYDDGALPSASGVLIATALASGDAELMAKARKMRRIGSAEVVGQPLWYASHARLLLTEPPSLSAGPEASRPAKSKDQRSLHSK